MNAVPLLFDTATTCWSGTEGRKKDTNCEGCSENGKQSIVLLLPRPRRFEKYIARLNKNLNSDFSGQGSSYNCFIIFECTFMAQHRWSEIYCLLTSKIHTQVLKDKWGTWIESQVTAYICCLSRSHPLGPRWKRGSPIPGSGPAPVKTPPLRPKCSS